MCFDQKDFLRLKGGALAWWISGACPILPARETYFGYLNPTWPDSHTQKKPS